MLPDIRDLQDQLGAAERDAQVLVADLAEARGGWRAGTVHVIAAHERRHLWQAWRVGRGAEGAAAEFPELKVQ